MRSFLTIKKKPLVNWSYIPDGIFYEGEVPEGYDLAISPTPGYIIVDVDRHGDVDGFKNIPPHIQKELCNTFNYATRGNGMHYWFKYTGDKKLVNKPSGIGVDLRAEKGYVVFYAKGDIRDYMDRILETSETLNEWLEVLFYGKTMNK